MLKTAKIKKYTTLVLFMEKYVLCEVLLATEILGIYVRAHTDRKTNIHS